MNNYAVIVGNLVTNIIVADSKEIAEEVTNATCIEYDETSPVGIGWTYDGTALTPPIMNPPVEETPAPQLIQSIKDALSGVNLDKVVP